MADEPRWLSVEAVVALNREIAAESGEPHELRDRAALQIAVRRPWNIWVYFMDQDYAVLAVALMAAIFSARAFATGNKRTAYRAAVTFLEANGFEVALGDNRYALDGVFEFFNGRLSQTGVVEWFRMWMSSVGAR